MKTERPPQIIIDQLEPKDSSDSKSEDPSEIVASSSKLNVPIEYTFEPGELNYVKIIFLLIGTAGFINWQSTTNSFQTIFATVYGNPSGANMILIPFLFGAISVSIYRIYFKTISLRMSFFGIFLLFSTNLAIPITIQFASVDNGPIILHIILFFVGSGVGTIQGNLSVYAFLMPYNLFGLLLTGGGLSGLFAFIFWQILIRLFFDSSNISQLKLAIWIYYGINVAFIACLLGMFIYLIRKPWFKGSIKVFDDSKHIKLETNESSTMKKSFELKMANSTASGMRSYRKMFESSLPFILMSALSLGIHASMFPNISPYGWETSYDNRSFLVGINQTCEFIGRYLPYLASGRFIIPIKVAIILIFSRLFFLPIAILMGINEGPIASNFLLQLLLSILFSFSSGYLTIIPSLGAGRGLVSVAERGYMGMINFLTSQSALGIGILFSNLLISIINIQA